VAEEVEWGPFDEDYETAGGVVEGGGRGGGRGGRSEGRDGGTGGGCDGCVYTGAACSLGSGPGWRRHYNV